MKLLRFELKKLILSRYFLLLSILLLLGNALFLWSYERKKEAYFYVHEQGEDYRAFQAGEFTGENAGFYQAEEETQEEYFRTYQTFLSEMGDRADAQTLVSIFSKGNDFVERNRKKTVEDFEGLKGISFETGNYYAIRSFADHETGFLFFMIFLALAVYCVVMRERDLNLFPLLKSCQKGRMPLICAKLTILQFLAAVYVILQSLLEFFLLGYLYGWGDLGQPIQAVSDFRGCIFWLSIGEAVLVCVLVRTALAAVLAVFAGAIGVCFRRETEAILFTVAAGLLSFFCYRRIPAGGSLNFLRCVNPFYIWDMSVCIGEYQNLNIFGYPAAKELMQLLGAGCLYLASVGLSVPIFCVGAQIRSEARFGGIALWLRKKTGFLWRRSSLLYFELYKSLLQQRRGIVLLALLAAGGIQISSALAPDRYAVLNDAAYHYYLDQVEGPVTEEQQRFLAEEQERMAEQQEELDRLRASKESSDQIKADALETDIELYKEGFEMLLEQYALLTGGDPDRPGLYLVDESAYQALWTRPRKNSIKWILYACACIFLISGLHPMDRKQGILPILRTTRKGEAGLNRAKDVCAGVYILIAFILYEIPDLIDAYQIDQWKCIGASMSNFIGMQYSANWYIGTVIAAAALLKLLSFAAVGAAQLKISKTLGNEYTAFFAGAGAVTALGVLCYVLSVDFTTLILSGITVPL